MALLSQYQGDTRELIRDRGSLWTTTYQLNRWINQGRQKVAEVTGCLNCLLTGQDSFGSTAQPNSAVPNAMVPSSLPGAAAGAQNGASTNAFATIPGVEKYPFLFARPFLRAQFQGYGDVIDIFGVAVSWGGAYQPVMDWVTFDEIQAYYRATANTTIETWPSVGAFNGDGTAKNLWLFPIPPQQLVMQWNCYCVPMPIYSDSDFDAIPGGYESAVKYYAAYLCFMSSNRPGNAQIMLDQFSSTLGIGRVASDRGKVPSYYDID